MSISARDAAVVWHPFSQMQLDSPVPAIVRGEGALLYDEQGRSYVDAISSWWVNLHGHAHPHISDCIAAQLEKLHQVIFAGFTHEPAVELSERLLAILPSNQSRVFFSDDGSTAVEAALKICVQYWGNKAQPRRRFVAFKDGYHGDTFGAMAVGGRGLFVQHYAEMLFEVSHVDPPHPGREQESVEQLAKLLDRGDVCAFIFEPLLQGVAGMRLHSAAGLDQMMQLCREAGVPTIADEILTGFGRTGRNFACNYLTEKPDLICLSKGLTGGTLPMGITTASNPIYERFLSDSRERAFLHGHSYTANPLACAAALASLDLLLAAECREQLARISEAQSVFLTKLQHTKLARNPRALGTVAAFEIGDDPAYGSQARDKILKFFLGQGLLIRPLGNTIYLLPPYCIQNADLERAQAACLRLASQGLP
ncbi:MAG: adenosylmethionine--8-amino-7-oxononanoate transaminase [Oligoflexia bacterium]|nr:adenosylmethionine--8-amino-7-oxononanoate transaminase [Oligoflexia bacterium]